MEDITNTSYGFRAASRDKELLCGRGIFHEPVGTLDEASDAPKKERKSALKRVDDVHISSDFQHELFRGDGEISPTLDGCPAARVPCETAYQLQNSCRDAVRGGSHRLHAEAGDVQSSADSLVLQNAAARFHNVMQSVELEGRRLQDTADLFPLFERKLGHVEKVCWPMQ
jgi:hypothetical protein